MRQGLRRPSRCRRADAYISVSQTLTSALRLVIVLQRHVLEIYCRSVPTHKSNQQDPDANMYLAYRRCKMCPRRQPIVRGTYQTALDSSIRYQRPLTASIVQCRKKFLQTRPLNIESQQPPSGSAFTCLPMQSRQQ